MGSRMDHGGLPREWMTGTLPRSGRRVIRDVRLREVRDRRLTRPAPSWMTSGAPHYGMKTPCVANSEFGTVATMPSAPPS